MIKLLSFALFFGLSLGVHATDSLEFGGAGPKGVAKLQVYIDKDESQPRCMCSRFSVLVNDRDDRVGATRISKVTVVTTTKTASGEEKSSKKEFTEFRAVFRNPQSPVKTAQILNLGRNTKDLQFKVMAERKKCMNPTQPACKKMVVEVLGEFNGADLADLVPVRATEIAR